jgi:hypothetical protein
LSQRFEEWQSWRRLHYARGLVDSSQQTCKYPRSTEDRPHATRRG